ncbi:DUF421 domain-containing protein [Marinicrinis sediminis]|uniref:DUF421 domain-containing protein n=1 Tax=Marinicrinis sediminis TaxID=1652465 RepID=A0ABW5R7P9_9BACL
MEDYMLTFVKALGMFAVGMIAFRIMGSQSVGRLTDFDLVVVIAIGALIGDVLADQELNPFVSLVAIGALVLAQVVMSFLAMKSSWIEKVVMGRPIRVIHHGKVIRSGLRKARLTEDSLMQELRTKGIASPATVKEAYLEPAGKISVIEDMKSS